MTRSSLIDKLILLFTGIALLNSAATLLGCNPSVEDLCTDGVDNDGDGETDCADDDCQGAESCSDGGVDSGTDTDSSSDTDDDSETQTDSETNTDSEFETDLNSNSSL